MSDELKENIHIAFFVSSLVALFLSVCLRASYFPVNCDSNAYSVIFLHMRGLNLSIRPAIDGLHGEAY